MWDADSSSSSSPQSRIILAPFNAQKELSKPELQRDRSQRYYAEIPRERANPVLDPNEREFGWGSNANAIRDASASSSEPQPAQLDLPALQLPPLPSLAYEEHISLGDLIDPSEVQPPLPSVSEVSKPRKGGRLKHYWKRILSLVSCATTPSSMPPSDEEERSAKAPISSESEALRRARERSLNQRHQRGSIILDIDTGIAQIPLYAAPDTALIAGAPALSSFAPRAPLEAAQHKLPLPASVPAVAKASATVDMDGRILEVNKSRNYVKENKRYSSFVRNSAASNNSPSPV
ncbi:MAG: hypothetical protein CYPHOPRED_003085 [Cyphobasidiales sp. Tagirdzhanova-0007]|nr:MAG: hypothetical protein CYPHOPRED_003085 [Cyphobasidiales sp. Tagirdzhanova-0007]